MTFGAHAHPYLLGDNRHYTFYLWRRVLSLPLARAAIGLLLPVPFFLASHALRVSTRSLAIVHCFWIACLLTLVPAPLLEPRYWTPAVVLFLLHLDGARTTILASYLLLVLCATGTCAVVAIFLLLPYRWNDNSIARFVF
jgi:alpha-1,2-glucosyltransferase